MTPTKEVGSFTQLLVDQMHTPAANLVLVTGLLLPQPATADPAKAGAKAGNEFLESTQNLMAEHLPDHLAKGPALDDRETQPQLETSTTTPSCQVLEVAATTAYMAAKVCRPGLEEAHRIPPRFEEACSCRRAGLS